MAGRGDLRRNRIRFDYGRTDGSSARNQLAEDADKTLEASN